MVDPLVPVEVQTGVVRELKLTVNPEDELALTVKGAVPNTWFEKCVEDDRLRLQYRRCEFKCADIARGSLWSRDTSLVGRDGGSRDVGTGRAGNRIERGTGNQRDRERRAAIVAERSKTYRLVVDIARLIEAAVASGVVRQVEAAGSDRGE